MNFSLSDFFIDGKGFKAPSEKEVVLELPTPFLQDIITEVTSLYYHIAGNYPAELFIVGSVAREGNGERKHPDIDFLIRPNNNEEICYGASKMSEEDEDIEELFKSEGYFSEGEQFEGLRMVGSEKELATTGEEQINVDEEQVYNLGNVGSDQAREALYLKLTDHLRNVFNEEIEVFIGTTEKDANGTLYHQVPRINITQFM